MLTSLGHPVCTARIFDPPCNAAPVRTHDLGDVRHWDAEVLDKPDGTKTRGSGVVTQNDSLRKGSGGPTLRRASGYEPGRNRTL